MRRVWILFVLLFAISIAGEEQAGSVVGILGAFGPEVALIEKELQEKQVQEIRGLKFTIGKLKGQRVVVALSGVGKVNAAMTTTLLLEHYKPQCLIFTGIAGGINPELKPGDIVIGQKSLQHDLGHLSDSGMERQGMSNPVSGKRNPPFFPGDERLLACAEAAGTKAPLEGIKEGDVERRPRIVKGIIATGDVFVASEKKKNELRSSVNADAVEMEGGAVAQLCWQWEVPCLIVRSLSDNADGKAEKEMHRFYEIAAANSARLVSTLVGELQEASKPGETKP